ncbi:GNAT family N-acetyltransferase [Streptomyces meridianus]|uniref:GNAT family N-acetyltransferase n=1 Tax=Streptomyces meridianus TaxID=2938945 RepID=A0ABT0XC42_9ACTN|nr:GNAT family N-acetyltransferase [Streptomyces meridianus]MCM2579302.1 GNAT family N-acetyltransferase [Streptomyces meridianus]
MTNTTTFEASWGVAREPVGSADALALFRDYYTEVSDRYYLLHEGHRTAPEELARCLAEETGAELEPPKGVLLVARYGGEAAGCTGIRLVDDRDRTAELSRVFVRRERRGCGGGARLLAEAEHTARGMGAERIVLDTRHDLVEARALYARHGYAEVPAFNSRRYAQRWFAKELTG